MLSILSLRSGLVTTTALVAFAFATLGPDSNLLRTPNAALRPMPDALPAPATAPSVEERSARASNEADSGSMATPMPAMDTATAYTGKATSGAVGRVVQEAPEMTLLSRDAMFPLEPDREI